ncbi:DMT family transporter [Inhella proteolytica]|uniref:DMT family transporter n=1 Tax=Inhella proteolytica TaxID=2795029 RepID=A0A931J389_9BURK|nr:DMT family transporter [Inhella proteolytica]MBH9575385.1 DMT family transporter [Inhella proteolytica]
MTAPHALTPRLALLLSLPPLLWAGNAVVGKLLVPAVPPALLNLLRWSLALALLLPLTQQLWRERGLLTQHWRWLAGTGLLGMGLYNALLYRALHSSDPLNVTLIAASLPLSMLLVGLLAFGVRPTLRQGLGALLSLLGVAVVISQGEWQRLRQVAFVQGDVLMLLANLAWALYSWLLARAPKGLAHWNWADLLAAQALFGLVFAGLGSLAEQAAGAPTVQWSGTLLLGLLYIAVGPSLIAYRCWGLGVREAGPALTGFFINLTPLFAALLSAALIGSMPRAFHALAFALIAAGILVSSRR